MANLSFNSPLPSLWGIGPYQFVSEPYDSRLGAYGGPSSSGHGFRRVSPEEQRRSAEEGLRSHQYGWGSPQYGFGHTPAMELPPPPSPPPPPPPPPPPEPYGMFFTSPSPYYDSPLVDLYQQQYATPTPSPPEHAHYCYQLSSHQQWPYSPPPPQQHCQSPSSIGYPPLEIVSSFPAPYQQYPTTPQPYTTSSMCLKQHNQPAPYVFDEMSVREKTPDSFGSLCSNQLRGLEGPDIPDIHPHAGGAPGQGLGEHGKVDDSEQSRMRKLGSMGWCRRCMLGARWD